MYPYLSIALTLGLPTLGLSVATPPPRFANRDVSIAEAPAANLLPLSPHPNPDIFTSPVRSRIAALTAKLQSTSSKRTETRKGNATINTIFSGVYPVLNVTWGNKPDATGPAQSFISFIDTGSSDTWVVSQDLECVDITTRVPLEQSACGFGVLYDTSRDSFCNITGERFSVSYFPENEALSGAMGYAPITLGGLTVPQQQVALVDYAAWVGDGFSSGLVGFGYPLVTSAINVSSGDDVQYDPVFTSMVKQGIVSDAVFTLALDRVPRDTALSAPAGMMALGGLVPDSYYDAPFTSVPIELTEGYSSDLSLYAITHEFVYGVRNGSKVSAGTYQSIVDSGTAPNFIPTTAANELNAQFDPPAVFNDTLGYWTVDCNATAPYAAFVIGDVEMPMDPRDMIVRSLNGLPGYDDVCFSAFADGGDPSSESMIIGEVWQLNYVVAYDQGRSMMHFAKRKPY